MPLRSSNFTNLSRFDLPGFNLPLNFIPHAPYKNREGVEFPATGEGHNLFANALNDSSFKLDGRVQLPLTTLREFTMLHLMNQLTDKPNWNKKVLNNAAIVSKWKSEALATKDIDITQKMVDWCIEELQYRAKVFERTGAVIVYDGDVVKSDVAVPDSIKEDLKAAVISLEDVPVLQRDWHPGSNETVLDLVHPSLFPLIYGQSRILSDSLVRLQDCIKHSGEGQVIEVPPEKETDINHGRYYDFERTRMKPFSRNFQWLPCEVDISGKESARITSYINNLHPEKHKNLYTIIENIISCAIPLWNLTLTRLKAQHLSYNRILYKECRYDPDPEMWPDTEGPQPKEGEEDDDYYERRDRWFVDTRRVIQPEPGSFSPPTVPEHMKEAFFIEGTDQLKPEKSVDLRRDYGKRGLQIIVKLANIHLTPEKPEYSGGTWHVEGQLNEHICSTAIYYYDNSNITTSRLKFRQQCRDNTRETIDYRQYHYDWLKDVFGCEQEGPGVQEIGTVDSLEGRLLTWPNILQHRVEPFKLADSTKPGHRKILALFLVDPNIRIASTANVPCQQREWWGDAIRQGDGAISRLPVELQDQIFGYVEDFPVGLKEAKELRLKLIDERKAFVTTHNEWFQDEIFSLCEH